MDEKTIHSLLDNIAERNIPDSVDILPRIEAQMGKPTRNMASPLRYPSKATAILVACLLCVATTVYAVVQLQIHDPALDESMVTELDLSQTIDGITVTLDWAYADANRIVVAYTMSDDEGESLVDGFATHVQMWDSEGHRFLPVGAFWAEHPVPEMLRGNAHFDASIIEDAPELLDLELLILGKYNFDFSVPFIPGVRIDQQPEVEMADLGITLESAIITPSMTRVYICYDTPNAEMWFPVTQLAFDGQPVALEPGATYPDTVSPYEDGGRCRGNFFLANYEDLPEQMTLTVERLQTPTYYSEENMRRAAAFFAEHGIEAVVVRNEAQTTESYLLNFPGPDTDYKELNRLWDEALLAAGEPLSGEWIDGPWEITVDLR